MAQAAIYEPFQSASARQIQSALEKGVSVAFSPFSDLDRPRSGPTSGKFRHWRHLVDTDIVSDMRAKIDNIEAGKILPPDELARLGLTPRRLLRVVLETVDAEDAEISITAMNARGGAFAHLADEPDLYSDADLIERNEAFSG